MPNYAKLSLVASGLGLLYLALNMSKPHSEYEMTMLMLSFVGFSVSGTYFLIRYNKRIDQVPSLL